MNMIKVKNLNAGYGKLQILFDVNAKIGEAVVDNDIDLEKYGIEKDEVIIFKQMKKNKNRYCIY